MATSVLTATVVDPGGNVVATSSGTKVNFRLMANGSPTPGYRISDGVTVASLLVTSASTQGAISQALENNANITPTGTYYTAEILCPSSQGGTQEWALISSSSASPQGFKQALAAVIPSFTPITTVPPNLLSSANIWAATNQFNGDMIFGSNASAMEIQDVPGTGGRRLSIQPINQPSSTSSGGIQIIPGVNSDPLQTPIYLEMFAVTGNNYERMVLQYNSHSWVQDVTYYGAGEPRNYYFKTGGTVDPSTSTPGQTAWVVYSDASVDLLGANYTASGKTWGATRTRIADPANSGDSRLIIDTRTGTPSSVFTDDALVQYGRGGTPKWLVGLNAAGNNNDSLDFFSVGTGSNVLQLHVGTNKEIGFYGIPPTTQHTVTGGRATGVALTNLLTALNASGLIIDATTA